MKQIECKSYEDDEDDDEDDEDGDDVCGLDHHSENDCL